MSKVGGSAFPAFAGMRRDLERGSFDIYQMTIGLLVTSILTAVSMFGVRSYLHNGNLLALETLVDNLRTAAHDYSKVNGSYSGISCTALQNMQEWPTNGCLSNGNVYTSIYGIGMVTISQTSNNTESYTISISESPSLTYWTTSDFRALCNRFYTLEETPCSPGTNSVQIVF